MWIKAKQKRNGKKAVMFTIMSLVLVMIIMFMLGYRAKKSLTENEFIIENRVKSMDHFIDDIERDIKRGIYISGFRAIVGIEEHIATTGNYLNDTQRTFNEIMINGTINNTYISVMNNTELSKWIDRVKEIALQTGIILDYKIINTTVFQENPWEISFALNIDMNITDISGIARWERNSTLVSKLSIVDFEDPLFIVNGKGRILRTIKPTNITTFVTGQDTTKLLEEMQLGMYKESDSAPSFLMRFSGNLGNSSNGIESFVDLKEFEDNNLNVNVGKSIIDYIYFNTTFNPASYRINNTYNWFRLDNESEHIDRYNATEVIII